jgi:hypothetical protein
MPNDASNLRGRRPEVMLAMVRLREKRTPRRASWTPTSKLQSSGLTARQGWAPKAYAFSIGEENRLDLCRVEVRAGQHSPR